MLKGPLWWCHSVLPRPPGSLASRLALTLSSRSTQAELAAELVQQLRQGFPPVWALDFPPMAHRITGWLFPKHGITGFTYWDTLYASDGVDVWTDAGTFKTSDGAVYNGDGSYIYPATEERQGRHAPVASMRLKWLRETVEDYDYLMLARQFGLNEEAQTLASGFARGFGDWDDNPGALMDARLQLGALIEAAQQRKQTASAEKGGAP